ncbi:MAG: ATP-binding protein [Acidimicrobiia bacterium]|nr:ATP-binding protein [Acidimicrobiia bacterium]
MTERNDENSWYDDNYRWLAAGVRLVAHDLEWGHGVLASDPARSAERRDLVAEQQEVRAAMSSPPALDVIANTFGLSSFERNVLLLCAATELDGNVATICAEMQGGNSYYPTLSLALGAFPDADWGAITPNAPLRHWRLVTVGERPSVTLAPLRIDERVLSYLTGIDTVDESLGGFLEPPERDVVPSHGNVARTMAAAWAGTAPVDHRPVVEISGRDPQTRRAVAAEAAASLGLWLYVIPVERARVDADRLDTTVRLWGREAILAEAALMLETDDLDPTHTARVQAVKLAIDSLTGPLVLSQRTDEAAINHGRPTVRLAVHNPEPDEQRRLWMGATADRADDAAGTVSQLVGQFDLSARQIESAAHQALSEGAAPEAPADFASRLWASSRNVARTGIGGLAQQIEPKATWNDLVVPESTTALLRDILHAVRHRSKVYGEWGFANRSSRGLGIGALFAGPSGTGKTMAAEVIAAELELDLFVIDLSSLMDKYIGETEKNLRRVFDAAEAGGAILVFDEADAVFGKRTEVRDSHDRYANVEVSYLLTRMESYRGLAVLTTNRKDALDTAFVRRLRYIVKFPHPHSELREELWRKAFPAETPHDELDYAKLASVDVAGGTIRNIALGAAFLAAEENRPVSMAHVLHATRAEFAKTDRTLSLVGEGGWA